GGGDPSVFHAATHDLGEGKTLYVVECSAGAYQTGSVLFLGDDSGLRALSFPDYSTDYGWSGNPEGVGESFSDKDKTLNTFAKFRGVGDCGSTAQYHWTGYGFELLEYTYKDCVDDGSQNADQDWPVIYKAKE